jgi:hypothetical protein
MFMCEQCEPGAAIVCRPMPVVLAAGLAVIQGGVQALAQTLALDAVVLNFATFKCTRAHAREVDLVLAWVASLTLHRTNNGAPIEISFSVFTPE